MPRPLKFSMPPIRVRRVDRSVLEAAADAFNAARRHGDQVRVFEHYHPKRGGRSVLRTVKDGAFIRDSYVFVDLADADAVFIGCVEWQS